MISPRLAIQSPVEVKRSKTRKGRPRHLLAEFFSWHQTAMRSRYLESVPHSMD
jgi:hypothetical protein